MALRPGGFVLDGELDLRPVDEFSGVTDDDVPFGRFGHSQIAQRSAGVLGAAAAGSSQDGGGDTPPNIFNVSALRRLLSSGTEARQRPLGLDAKHLPAVVFDAGLVVLTSEVGQAADRRVVPDGGVGPMVVVVVDPCWQSLASG